MNASEIMWGPQQESGYSSLGMERTTTDLGHDLVIEDLDEATTQALAPMCVCSAATHREPAPFGTRSASTGHTRPGTHLVLTTC